MDKINVICCGCGVTFQKDYIEYRRRLYKQKTKMFCTKQCFSKTGTKSNGKYFPPGMGEKYKHNLVISTPDEYSPFRYYVNQAKRKWAKYGDTDLTITGLKTLWDKQSGICSYSGIKMQLPPTTLSRHDTPDCASLDRIDSTRGYFMDNIEFVCLFINYAKNRFTKDQTTIFIKKLVEVATIEDRVL